MNLFIYEAILLVHIYSDISCFLCLTYCCSQFNYFLFYQCDQSESWLASMQNKYRTFPVIMSAGKHKRLVVLQNYYHVHKINKGNIAIVLMPSCGTVIWSKWTRESLGGFSSSCRMTEGSLTASRTCQFSIHSSSLEVLQQVPAAIQLLALCIVCVQSDVLEGLTGAGRPSGATCWRSPGRRVLPVWAGRWWAPGCRGLQGRGPAPCSRSRTCRWQEEETGYVTFDPRMLRSTERWQLRSFVWHHR